VTLLQGDLLFTVAAAETLGGVAVDKIDVILFRPTRAGDYTSGTFSILLHDPMAGNPIRDFALVEKSTVVAGTTLNAGDFLLVAGSSTYDKDVTRYQVTDVGASTTSGTRSELIDGGSAGIGFGVQIWGLELVQTTATLGGKTLTAGQLLISLNGVDTVGTNNLSTTAYDIFVLDVTATGTGTSSATATLLVQGSDIGLDAGGEQFDGIALLPLNSAPVLDASKSPSLSAINEDAGAPSGAVGTLVSSLVDFASPSGQVDNVTDGNTSDPLGIAVTAADTTKGTWWYSTDGGTTWLALGTPSSTTARLLAADANTRIYFQPTANYNGTLASAITFRAWDRTSGTNGSTADTSANGGTNAFSTATDTASLVVNPVNDAPVLSTSGPVGGYPTNENTASTAATVSSLLTAGGYSDVDSGSSSGVAVIGVIGNGKFQYSTDGVTWNDITSVSSTNALLLSSSTQVRYMPDGQNGETASAIYKAWDQTSGTASANGTPHYADTSSSGGTTAFSTNYTTATISVTSVNDAPTITSGATVTLIGTNEDTTSSATLASSILSSSAWADVDTSALSGLAITATTGNGTWQYSTDGTNWNNFGAVSSTSALLITSTTQVRYIPDAKNGETATFSYKAWDQTTGTASATGAPSYASTASSGGTAAFSASTATASMTITAVNDAPTAVSDAGIAIEAGGTNNGTAGTSATGNVLSNDTDIDNGDTRSVSGVAAGTVGSANGSVGSSVTGTYGSISIGANGSYTYTVDENNATVQALRTTSDTILDVFTYTIKDAGGLASTTQITVTIKGANDAPYDLSAGALTIAEQSANGSVVGTVTGSDVDSGDTLTYQLTDNAGGRFAIDSTGKITVADGANLDYEAASSHTITVRVTDTAGATYDESFTVNLTDVDEFDTGPVTDANGPTANAVAENASVGTAVGITASATDADGTNNTITYSLVDNDGGRFAIDGSTGVVTVAGAIDREADGASRTITVRATSADGSYTDQNFSISIADVDEFNVGAVSDNDATANSVAENSSVGTVVGITAAASDADATTNAITYSLFDNDGGRFAINSSTGVVTVAGAIDREADGASRTITVRATSADGSYTDQNFSISIADVDEFNVGAVSDNDATA
ncbi:MAG: beta strand repeat-containing protein, partial [Aureliella sp.]